MTEAELKLAWDRCTQAWSRYAIDRPAATSFGRMIGGRRLRLLACACCRKLWHRMTARDQELLVQAERHADGKANKSKLTRSIGGNVDNGLTSVAVALCAYIHNDAEMLFDAIITVRRVAGELELGHIVHTQGDVDLVRQYTYSVEDMQFQLLRDMICVIPNFQFQKAWRTSSAVGIAQAIYAERAFDRLPILADALQDAGCEDADVLAHCRGPGPHVRGCWVVDLVLGKE
jgi:hypothetical protein